MPPFAGTVTPDFAAVGDRDGRLILASPGRAWFPTTERLAGAGPLVIAATGAPPIAVRLARRTARSPDAQRCRSVVGTWSPLWIGRVELDVLLGDVHSLNGKRAHVRPLVADLRRVFSVSAGEVADHDLHRRAKVGVSLVAGDGGPIAEVLNAVERFVADRPELELLSAHRGLASSDDD